MSTTDRRRHSPRILLDGLCGVLAADEVRPASVRDVSADGLRVERPFDPKTARRVVQLELELPGLDEIMWASGVVTFAHLIPMGGTNPDGQPRFMCRAGLRLDGMARRERRLLREFVHDSLWVG